MKITKEHKTIALGFFIFFTIDAFLHFIRFVTNELALGHPGKFLFFLIMETTGSYSFMIVLPFIFLFITKFPIKKRNWPTRVPVHFLASIFFGVSHTLLMLFSRKAIFRLADLGPYVYGELRFRIPMEYTHQIFSYWFFYGLVVVYGTWKEHQEQKQRAAKLEQQLTATKLRTLRMQLQPHFLFNTLNMISSTMYDDTKKADRMIASLSDLLRNTLNSSFSEKHPLFREMEIVDLYIELMKARYEDKLFFKTAINDYTGSALIPGFILQPIVENSIKYSMENLNFTEIEITADKNDDRLILKIRDNGPGIPDMEGLDLKRGIGLSNTMERLENLYADDYNFQMENHEQGGFQVKIEIPFET